MKQVFISIVLFALPTLVSAASFVQTPLFLSKSPVTEGQKVRVYAIVSNDAAAAFTGTVIISADGTKLGSPAATLAVGATQTVSVAWTPSAGQHTVTAQLTADDGTSIQQISQTFTIQAIPTATVPDTTSANTGSAKNTDANGIQSSSEIQHSIGTLSPAAEQYSAPVFKAVDSGRVFAANQLNKAIDWSKQQAGVAPKQTTPFVGVPGEKKTGASNSIWAIVATAVLYILSVLLYVVGNAGVFYPILAIAFFYILWKCFRRYRRR